MLLGSIKSYSQTKGTNSALDVYTIKGSSDYPSYKVHEPSKIWCFNYSGDTLLIKDVSTFKYIKIGDRVYKIESPTLTEVVKQDTVYRNGFYFNDPGTKTLLLYSDPYYIAEPFRSIDTTIWKLKKN